MILLFNIIVIDEYLFNNPTNKIVYEFRNKSNYIHNNLEITKYSLLSYTHIEFSEIYLNIELSDQYKKNQIEPFLKNHYKNAEISFSRSTNAIQYLNFIKKFNFNDWIFFCPNHDHPFISKSKNILKELIQDAETAEKNFKEDVVIYYSHFFEMINSISSDKYLWGYAGIFGKVLYENNKSFVVEYNKHNLSSIQIIRKSHFEKILNKNLDKKIFKRLEDSIPYKGKVIAIIPKIEVCRHFDSYIHTKMFYKSYISYHDVPLLFIPNGIFENNIKIKYGYDKYFKNYVNINPKKKDYIFESINGTDIINTLESIPYFWKDRISEIDVNEKFIFSKHEEPDLNYPWSNLSTFEVKINIIRNVIINFFNKLKETIKIIISNFY